MNPFTKIMLIFGVLICIILGYAYYAFIHLYFNGQKDQKIVKENLKHRNNILLSAEYRNGTNYCNIDLLDSINIEINVGDKTGGTILNKEYSIFNDTIVVTGGVEQARKYLFGNKFLIHENKLLFRLDSNGIFDTITTMKIKFNKIKL